MGEYQQPNQMSTRELLAELDKLHIRYPPRASRQDLERLLERHINPTGRNAEQESLVIMVQKLMALGIRIPRHASRDDLESLLRQVEENPEILSSSSIPRRGTSAGSPSSSSQTKRRRRHHVTIARLCKELDDLGIKYPPGASPKLLQRLLNESELDDQQLSPRPRARTERRQSARQKRNVDPPPPQERIRQPSTRELLEELNQRGIRFPPTATREELQDILRQHRRKTQQSSKETEGKNYPSDETDTIDRSTRERRQARNVNNKYQSHATTTSATNVDEDSLGNQETLREEYADNAMQSETSPRRKSTNDIRQPVEQARGSSRSREDPQNRAKRVYNPRDRDLSRQSAWSDVYAKSKQTVSDSVFETIPKYTAKKWTVATSRLSRVAEKAVRKARYATRTAKDYFAEDEYGIRDVDFEYVTRPQRKKNIIIDVPAEPVVDTTATQSTTEPMGYQYASRARAAAQYRRQRVPNERGAEDYGFYRPSSEQDSRRRYNRRPSTNGRATPKRRKQDMTSRSPASQNNPASSSSLFRLPPARSGNEEATSQTPNNPSSSTTPRRRRRRSTAEADANRRIYTPYNEDDAPSQVYRDAIDRFGDFFVNTTDTILWGKLDDEGEPRQQKKPASSSKSSARTTSDRPSAGRERAVNWKDRMEERFDSMLGIHEEGEYYSRWAKQEELDEQEEGGYDAFSVAQGRGPKKHHHPRRRKVYDKPFWERSNLISSLFGRAPPSGYDGVGVGNLLPFIKTLAKTIVSVAGNACDWASVRGSLPQPVVVVGVTSCVLSARPERRLLTMVISLVAFRIFGELIHEGLYGGEDWDEGEDDEQATA